MTAPGKRRWWWAVVGLGTVAVVGVLVQAGLAGLELWNELTAGGDAPAVEERASERGLADDDAEPVEPELAGPSGVDPDQTKPSRALPIAPRVATLGRAQSGELDSDQLHRLEQRRAARERWRATQSPEELEARRQRQLERRAARSQDEVAIRQRQKADKQRVLGAEDEDDAP